MPTCRRSDGREEWTKSVAATLDKHQAHKELAMNRRDFLRTTGTAGGLAIVGVSGRRLCNAGESQEADAAAGRSLSRKLPRWRGFNLLEKFMVHASAPFVASDFQWMAEWGFDFVRLPMDYRCWTDPADPYKLNENVLKEIDQAVEFGRRHGVHVSLNLHRAPGYTVAKPPETLDLWTDEEAQKQFDFQWSEFARRYRGIPSAQVSFDLVNEPKNQFDSQGPGLARRYRGPPPAQVSFALVNEPAQVSAEAYAEVARRA